MRHLRFHETPNLGVHQNGSSSKALNFDMPATLLARANEAFDERAHDVALLCHTHHTSRDAVGRYLDGSKNYKITLPVPIPVGQFWSFVVTQPAVIGPAVH
jgi:hypothetical protein